jgi:lipid-A-disaccharide synthase
MPRVLFIAGDPSGDFYAAHAAEEIKTKDPRVEILALGGPSLRAAAHHFLFDLVSEGVMGFWEPLKKIPRFWHILHKVLEPALTQWRPDVTVPVDFFGFNRFAAQAARRAGSLVFYFVSPQIWASRPGRIHILKKTVDKMLVIFPFEELLYRSYGVPAAFVGHPLMDLLPDASAASPRPRVEPIVGLLPGSRPGEVRRHLPLFLKTADLLSQKIPGIRFVLFAAKTLSNDFYDRLLGPGLRRPYLLEIVRDENYEWRSGLDLALTVSGTATLENALLGIPMVVVYKTSWITYSLARALIKVRYIAMANLLADRELVPELVQHHATPERLAAASLDLARDPGRRQNLRRDLLALRTQLGGPGAFGRIAAEILKGIKKV